MRILQFFKITIIVHSFFFCMLSISESNNNTSSPYDHEMLAQKLNGQNNNGIPKSSRRKKRQQLFDFSYIDTPLVDIINNFTYEKKVNVILPVEADTIEVKVTIDLGFLSLNEAWTVIHTLLDMAGYIMIGEENKFFVEKMVFDPEGKFMMPKQPTRLFVGTPPDQLPNSQELITYIYYMANLTVTDDPDSEVYGTLKKLLPKSAKILIDTTTNSIILTAEASAIRAAMQIISALDKTEFKENIEYVPLQFISAKLVYDLFQEIIKPDPQLNRFRLDARKKQQTHYFSKHIKVIPLIRLNSVVLMGRQEAIDKVKNFIHKHIDVELDTGESILHIYKLQYLDAAPFAEVLKKIVASDASIGTGQAVGSRGPTSTERFFEGVIITADSTKDEETTERAQADRGSDYKISKTTGESYRYYGGNKLVIAARNDDWARIRELIEQLDTPQPQVIIEVLIADLSLEDTRLLGSILRNPYGLGACPSSCNTNAQAAHASRIILDPDFLCPDGASVPTSLQSDLLGKVFNSCTQSVASTFSPGSTAIAFNDKVDGRTWGLLQIQDLFQDTKILSNPHVIATNNQESHIKIGELRLVPGPSSGAEGGTTEVAKVWIEAALDLRITPRISSANTVNLTIIIEIDRFQNPATQIVGAEGIAQALNNIDTRQIVTNANVHDRDVLALGGLTRIDLNDDRSGTPLLSKIPIFGYLFKKRNQVGDETNLVVFISPTIVQPRLRGGTSKYTNEYVKKSRRQLQDAELFDSLRDPITRFFFDRDTVGDPVEILDRFVSKDEFQRREALGTLSDQDNAIVDLNSSIDIASPQDVVDMTKNISEQSIAEMIADVQRAPFKNHTSIDIDKLLAQADTNTNPHKKTWKHVVEDHHKSREQRLQELLAYEVNPLKKTRTT